MGASGLLISRSSSVREQWIDQGYRNLHLRRHRWTKQQKRGDYGVAIQVSKEAPKADLRLPGQQRYENLPRLSGRLPSSGERSR